MERIQGKEPRELDYVEKMMVKKAKKEKNKTAIKKKKETQKKKKKTRKKEFNSSAIQIILRSVEGSVENYASIILFLLAFETVSFIFLFNY